MKKFWIRIFVLPNLRSAAEFLRSKDENEEGVDDEAAAAIDFALDRLEKWLASKEEA